MDPTPYLSDAVKQSYSALSYSGVNDTYSVRSFILQAVRNCERVGLVPELVITNFEYIAQGSGIDHPDNKNEAKAALRYLTSGKFRILE